MYFTSKSHEQDELGPEMKLGTKDVIVTKKVRERDTWEDGSNICD